jgi:glycosyltransferase involved in cell wall biosynthesis
MYKALEEVLLNPENALSGRCEIIFIDDGSTDGTLSTLRGLSSRDKTVHYISFSRNFGKEAAMLAGLQMSTGEWVVMLDADLQHPPAYIPVMLKEAQTGGVDCVVMVRDREGDGKVRTILSNLFYKLFSMMADMELTDGAGDFRLMNRAYVNALLMLNERNRFLKCIYPWIGFKVKSIEYRNVQRAAGVSKWTLGKLFKYSFNGIIGFSSKLLSFASLMGIVTFIFALGIFIFFFLRKLIYNAEFDGFTTLVCLLALFAGVILFSIGILGQYIGRIYTEVKQRPQYIVKEKV